MHYSMIAHKHTHSSNALLVVCYVLRDWSLITGRGGGGYKAGGGVHVKFYPYVKGGGKSFSHAEGGAHTVLG